MFLVGGNPAPRLLWLLGERRLEGKLEQEQEGRTLSRLRLPVSREDDGRILKCEARHEALIESLRAEAPLTIQCEKFKKYLVSVRQNLDFYRLPLYPDEQAGVKRLIE
jgi:hypothetical protein